MNAATRRRTGLIIAALPILLLHGCAGLIVLDGAAKMVHALPSDEKRWVETQRLVVAEPADVVFAVVVQEVERNGRVITERDAVAHALSVSYPFSWLKNNWGGTIKITCVAGDNGTTVILQGDGRDAVKRVRDIGDEMLGDIERALRRLPRTL